ncbi:hypothetical protein AJ78_06475 [Emergomyces pasteurianus Ep9510]|uniref:Uncharacterized protein n=1 Tax=Emergomyces pasteurianus Ep9510 TaxID=1447872 RepID=A0A1J9PAD7_9EURO|nr:hypothetical protein AJ78_06475 [Emergomyces pasteurianus Ep9510]
MINSHSVNDPDLTGGDKPNREADQTPENIDNGPLPTPAMTRQVPALAEEAPLKKESSSDFEDPMSDTNPNRMGHGKRALDGHGNSMSEETRMRLEIARLEYEIQRMKAGKSMASTAAGDVVSADLAAYLQQRGETPAVMKVINEFRLQVKLLRMKPTMLVGSSNYPMWREDVLIVAKRSGTNDILMNKELAPKEGASMDFQRFWEERNDWLYCYMWFAISAKAKTQFLMPKKNQMSAYMLWSVVEETFAEPLWIRRGRLFNELMGMTARTKGTDRAFIQRLIAIRNEYGRMGFNVPDYFFFDRLLTGVSKEWATFIENRMDVVAKDANATALEDDFMGLCRDILRRLPL